MTVKTHNNTKGLVRAFDVKTGKLLWTFNTIPQAGRVRQRHVGKRVVGDQRQHRRVDADHRRRRSRPRLPAGRDRRPPTSTAAIVPATTCSARALVCVDLKTGQRKWHFQIVHHPIWDYDLSSAPILMDINVNGKPIKAVALPSKEAFLYVFDRITGQPVWPIEEKPVPQSDVPGEKTSPTQPFPTKPPAYARQAVTVDDLIDFTPELNAEAKRIVSRYKLGPMFLPGVVSKVEGPHRGADDRQRPRAAPTGRAPAAIRKRTSSTRRRATTRSRRSGWSNRRPGSPTSATSRAPRDSRSSSAKGPGFGSAADAPQRGGRGGAAGRGGAPAAAARLRRPARRAAPAATPPAAPQGGGGGLDGAGASAPQAAVRPAERDRSRQGRAQVAGAARRHAGRGPQSSGAEGDEHPEDRPAGQRRPGRHQDAGRPRRSGGHDDAGASARRDAARLRQDKPARKSARSGCRRRRAARR